MAHVRTYVYSWLCNMCQTHFVFFHMKYTSAKQVSSPQSLAFPRSSPSSQWNLGAPSPAIKLILQCNETSIQDSSNQNMTHTQSDTCHHSDTFHHRTCRWITSWKPDKCAWRKPPCCWYPGASLRWSEDIGVKLAQRSCITCWSFTSQTHVAME